jgi:aminopeptidase C
MIKAGTPVFFGCDVGKFSDKESGIMDTALFDYEVIFFTSVCSRGVICRPSECL